MNPPFSKMAQVLPKIQGDGAHLVLIAPAWSKETWWPTLGAAAQAHVFLPAVDGLYLAGGIRPMPHPAWR